MEWIRGQKTVSEKWQMSELQFGEFEWNGVGAKKIESEKWQMSALQFGIPGI